MGKFFCRSCNVKGHDRSQKEATGETSATAAAEDEDDEGDADPASEGDASGSDTGTTRQKNTKKKILETMDQMVSRVQRFVKVGSVRLFTKSRS